MRTVLEMLELARRLVETLVGLCVLLLVGWGVLTLVGTPMFMVRAMRALDATLAGEAGLPRGSLANRAASSRILGTDLPAGWEGARATAVTTGLMERFGVAEVEAFVCAGGPCGARRRLIVAEFVAPTVGDARPATRSLVEDLVAKLRAADREDPSRHALCVTRVQADGTPVSADIPFPRFAPYERHSWRALQSRTTGATRLAILQSAGSGTGAADRALLDALLPARATADIGVLAD